VSRFTQIRALFASALLPAPAAEVEAARQRAEQEAQARELLEHTMRQQAELLRAQPVGLRRTKLEDGTRF
jgi:hypothetical protein